MAFYSFIERLNGNNLRPSVLSAMYPTHCIWTQQTAIPKNAMIFIQFESWVRKWLSTLPSEKLSTENALANDNQSIEPIYSCNWIEFRQQEIARWHGSIYRTEAVIWVRGRTEGRERLADWLSLGDGVTRTIEMELSRVESNHCFNANMKLKYR